MNNWTSRPLRALVTFQKGRKVATSEEPVDGYVPYLGASALSSRLIEEYGDPRFGVMASPHDVLMLWDGERSGLVGKSQSGVISSTVCRLAPNPMIETHFLFHTLDFKYPWIQGQRTGTGIPHVPKDLGRILSIDYPKEKIVQRKIALILTTIDNAIEKTEALIEKYQSIKQGMMHDLFTRGVTENGELRPPYQEAPHLYKQSELGWIPREWDVKKLGRILSEHGGFVQTGPFGSQLHSWEYAEEGVPSIMPQDIDDGEILVDQVARISELKANQLSRH